MFIYLSCSKSKLALLSHIYRPLYMLLEKEQQLLVSWKLNYDAVIREFETCNHDQFKRYVDHWWNWNYIIKKRLQQYDKKLLQIFLDGDLITLHEEISPLLAKYKLRKEADDGYTSSVTLDKICSPAEIDRLNLVYELIVHLRNHPKKMFPTHKQSNY